MRLLSFPLIPAKALTQRAVAGPRERRPLDPAEMAMLRWQLARLERVGASRIDEHVRLGLPEALRIDAFLVLEAREQELRAERCRLNALMLNAEAALKREFGPGDAA